MEPFARDSGEGESYWFAGNLVKIKAAAPEAGGLCVVEITAPPGFAPAPHIHERDEEALYILQGELRVTCGELVTEATPGSFVYMPRGIAHSFVVGGSEPARWLLLQTPFGDFTSAVQEIGQPAPSDELPPGGTTPANVTDVAAALVRHHVRIVAPRSPSGAGQLDHEKGSQA